MRSKHGFGNIIMTLATILLCLTLISSYLTAGMYARYVSSDSSSDSARVATFRVTETGNLTRSFAAELIPGETYIIPINVANESEVAISYTITIKNETNNLKLLKFSLGRKGGTRVPMTSQPDGSYLYTDCINASAASSYEIEILWTPSGDALAYMGYVDLITVILTATQVD